MRSSAPRVSSFVKDACLPLADTVLADDFESQLDRFYSRGTSDRPMLIDFGAADFVEVAALVNCVATLVQREEQCQPTFIALPSDRRVRDFFKVWRFAEAVLTSTGRNIANFLVSEDQRFIGEPQETYTGQGDALSKLEFDPDWEPGKKTSRNFFEFTTFKDSDAERIGPEGKLASAAREEGKKWTRPLIQQVLEKHLPGGSTKDEVARVVIYEAMSNAVRHPKASVILSVSKFERPGERPGAQSGSLRICLWDDGDGIAFTLMAALREGRPIRAFGLPSFMSDKVYVTIRNFTKTKSEHHIVDQATEITQQVATEPRVLLASLFPGVTRAVRTIVPKVLAFDEAIEGGGEFGNLMDILGGAPGMGLYALTRTVLDQFGGSLFIRSGNYRMLIEMAHDTYRKQHGARYKCKITQYEKHMPSFRGNLLAIQIPVQAQIRS
jgi:hypothetical protein